MPFLKDHVLIPSRHPNTPIYRSIHTPAAIHQPQWTLHRTDCFYAARTLTFAKTNAPLRQSPNTVPCTTCQPDYQEAKP